MHETRAESAFFKNWITIVVAVVSIVQGLAFAELAPHFPEIIDLPWEEGKFLLLSHFVLCFSILLRILQTYISAASDYDRWRVGFFDLLVIFILGALEYKIISYMRLDIFNIVLFHKWVCVIAVLALVAYSRVLLRLRGGIPSESYEEQSENLRGERHLQFVNIGGIAVSLFISLFIILSYSFPHWRQSDTTYAVLTLAYSGVMFFNTIYSIRNTSSIFIRFAPTHDKRSVGRVFVVPATERVSEPLFRLFVDNFSYFYENIFDATRNVTEKILRDLFFVSRGGHKLGYKAFNAAIDGSSGELVGMIMLGLDGKGDDLVSVLRATRIVFLRLGFFGLLRTLGQIKLYNESSLVHDSDSLHITYIAVCRDRKKSGIGKELLGFARAMAVVNGKAMITADVREGNKEALFFFQSQGFKAMTLPRTRFDDELGLGSIVRMKLHLRGIP